MTKPTDTRSWFRKLFCWGWCPCRHYEDEGGCGGQCIRCGRVVGYMTNAQLRTLSGITQETLKILEKRLSE